MRNPLIPALAALTLGLTLLPAASTFAAPVQPTCAEAGFHHQGEMRMERLFKYLNVTPEQKSEIKAIQQRHMQADKPLRESLRAKHMELFGILKSASGTREDAIAKQKEIETVQSQLSSDMVTAWFEARAVLTPEQIKKLDGFKPGQGRHQAPGEEKE